MQAFREEIEQGYNTLLYKYGAVSAELLKQGKSYSFIAETKGQGERWGSLSPYEAPSKIPPQAFSFSPKGKWGRRKSIDERPDCIDRKERFGDFEMDLIIGAQQREAILTLTERKTGYAIIEKLPNGKNTKSLAQVVNRSLAYFKRMGLLHSITTDNVSEFMAFRSIERALRIPVFFAKPYCSTDKPHVELPTNSFDNTYPKELRSKMLMTNKYEISGCC